MNDVNWIAIILIFWVLLITGMNYIYKDELIINALVEGNSTFVVSVDSDDFNITDDYSETSSTTKFVTKGWLSMLGRILTFRIPTVSQIPSGITNFVSVLNWFLLTLIILLFYRQVRSGSG